MIFSLRRSTIVQGEVKMFLRKIISLFFFTVFCILPVLAQEEDKASAKKSRKTDIRYNEVVSPVSLYKPIYLILGNKNDQMKMQFSAKYNLFHPFKFGLYLSYSQLVFWHVYKDSMPVWEIAFNPEVFWRFQSGDNIFGDLKIPFIDYFQIGFWEHKSNGRDGEDSRGYDRSYLQLQMSFGKKLNSGFNFKYFLIHDINEILPENVPTEKNGKNDDIQDYISSYETKLFFRIKGKEGKVNKEEIYFSFGPGGGAHAFNFKKGWLEAGFKSRAILTRVRGYLQVWRGYAESLRYYDYRPGNYPEQDPADSIIKNTAIRVGIILE